MPSFYGCSLLIRSIPSRLSRRMHIESIPRCKLRYLVSNLDSAKCIQERQLVTTMPTSWPTRKRKTPSLLIQRINQIKAVSRKLRSTFSNVSKKYDLVHGQLRSALSRWTGEPCLDEDLLHAILSGLELLVHSFHVLDSAPMADHLQRVDLA